MRRRSWDLEEEEEEEGGEGGGDNNQATNQLMPSELYTGGCENNDTVMMQY